MIDQIDARLHDWIRSILGTEVTVAGLPRPESPPVAASGVGVQLLDIHEAPAPRTSERPPLACQLRYLVTTWAPSSQDAHAMLGALLLAALDETRSGDLRLAADLSPIAPELWLALGVPLREALLVRLPLVLPRSETVAPRVTQTPINRLTHLTQFSTLQGRVLADGELPLPHATVVLLSTGRTTRTDRHGAFRLSMVPAGDGAHELEVRAKGKTQRFRAKLAPDQSAVLRFRIQEG